MKMRAAILHEQGKEHPFVDSKALSVEEVELDPPGEGEVLIKTGAAGLCHSDLSMINGTMQRKLPMVPGHEAAGIVEEVGKNVTQCKVGDHVVMSFVPICGKCEYCTSGRSNLCVTAFNARATGALINGERRLSLNGGVLHHTNGVSCYAEYMVACEDSIIVIDDDVPMVDAALFGCAVVTGVGAVVNTAKIPAGSTIAVVGLGGVGLCALLGGIVAGAARIVAIDLADDKLGLARQLGATDTFNAADSDCVDKVVEATKGGVEYAFDAIGVKATNEQILPSTRPGGSGADNLGGTAVLIGLPHENHEMSIPPRLFVGGHRQYRGSLGATYPDTDFPMFLQWYKEGKFPLDKLITRRYPLDEIDDAYKALQAGEILGRSILLY